MNVSTWISVASLILGVIVFLAGMAWNVYKVDDSTKKMINKIETGQQVAKVREGQHTKDITEIKDNLEKIMNGESKCRLQFERRISKVEQQVDTLNI